MTTQVAKDEIVDRLFFVFRDRGFEGASLADLSQATGLGKSSLYHHFPRGKEQMVEAVVDRTMRMIDSEILAAARSSDSLKVRTRRIAATLDLLYGGGRTPCLLGQLATSDVGRDARRDLRLAFTHWIDAFDALARESGMSPLRARQFAEDWVARLQGTLILQAVTGDVGPYKRALNALLALSKEDAVRVGV